MRRTWAFLLIVVLLTNLCLIAHASELQEVELRRYTAIYSLKSGLKISGNTASCQGVVTARDNNNLVGITMKLMKVNGTSTSVVKTWSGSGVGAIGVTLSKSCTVSSGTYFLRVTGTVKTSDGVKLETKSKDSAKVTK